MVNPYDYSLQIQSFSLIFVNIFFLRILSPLCMCYKVIS